MSKIYYLLYQINNHKTNKMQTLKFMIFVLLPPTTISTIATPPRIMIFAATNCHPHHCDTTNNIITVSPLLVSHNSCARPIFAAKLLLLGPTMLQLVKLKMAEENKGEQPLLQSSALATINYSCIIFV